MITRKIIAEKILSYLQHRITLQQIVQWAEDMLMNNEFKDDNQHTIRNILAHIGSADVKAFGLTWEGCEQMMRDLGFQLQVQATEV